MNIGSFILVINKNKNLYRRRCRVIDIIEEGNITKYLVYSEGLDEEELMAAEDIEVSQFQLVNVVMKNLNNIDFHRTTEEQKIVEAWVRNYNKIMEAYTCCFDYWDKRWDELKETDANLVQMLVNQKFSYVEESCSCERVPVAKSVGNKTLWGYADLKGNTIVEPQYTRAKCFLYGHAWVSDDNMKYSRCCDGGEPGNWGLIDQYGTLKIKPQYRYTSTFAPNYHRVSIVPTGGKYIRYGIVDDNNNVILPFVLYWDGISSGTVVRQCVAGSYADNDEEESAYGILDIITGEWRIPPVNENVEIYDSFSSFDEFELTYRDSCEKIGYYNVVTRTIRYYPECQKVVDNYVNHSTSIINTVTIKR